MSEPEKYVKIALEDMVTLFGDAEEYVVSLDRILSRIGAGRDPEILLNYVVDRQVFQRIAHARQVLAGALEEVVGVDEVERIAESRYRYHD